MNSASPRSGFLEELLGKILIALKLVGRFIKSSLIPSFCIKDFTFLSNLFWVWFFSNKKQVSPDLYGDNNTRFFTYWTVSSSNFIVFYEFPSEFRSKSTWIRCFSWNRVMHIKLLAATISSVLGLFKSIMKLLWVLAFIPFLLTEALNMILACSSGRSAAKNITQFDQLKTEHLWQIFKKFVFRTRKKETGGCNSEIAMF